MNLKKILATSLAAISVFGCALSASANSTVESKITVPDSDSHTYGIYQIFTGDSEGDALTSVKWGVNAPSGKTGNVEHDDLVELEKIAALTDDSAKLKGTDTTKPLTEFVDLDSTPHKTVKKGDTDVFVEEGYYLFKDIDTIAGSDTYTLYISKVAHGEDIEISRKAAKSVPSLKKEVQEGNTYTNGADSYIGGVINYKVTATLPDDLASYSVYMYKLTDTPSTGLTLDADSVAIDMDGNDVKESFNIKKEGEAIVISCDDILAIDGVTSDSVFIVTYTGSLNENAVTGTSGNANGATLEYSNNPNDTTATESKSSVEDEVNVYTYKFVVNEFDEKTPAQPLEGVGLTLYKKDTDGTFKPVGDEVTGVTTFEWVGLDDGEYKLVETTTPEGYKTMKDKTFDITSDIDENGNLKDLTTKLDGATVDVENGEIQVSIVNSTKVSLPVTGAFGLVALALAGAGIGGAALVMKKKED